jgi:hypothetical protein
MNRFFADVSFAKSRLKILPRDYAPGKFRSMTGPFPDWLAKRHQFLVPYALAWLLYAALCSHSNWQ